MKKYVLVFTAVLTLLMSSYSFAQKTFPEGPNQGYTDTGIGKGDLLDILNNGYNFTTQSVYPFVVADTVLYEFLKDSSRFKIFNLKTGLISAFGTASLGAYNDSDFAISDSLIGLLGHPTSVDRSNLTFYNSNNGQVYQGLNTGFNGPIKARRIAVWDGDFYVYDYPNKRMVSYIFDEGTKQFGAKSEVSLSQIVGNVSDFKIYNDTFYILSTNLMYSFSLTGNAIATYDLSNLPGATAGGYSTGRIFIEENGRISLTMTELNPPQNPEQFVAFFTPSLEPLGSIQLEETSARGNYGTLGEVGVDGEGNIYVGSQNQRPIHQLEYLNHAPTALDPNRTRYEYDIHNVFDFEYLQQNLFSFADDWNIVDEFAGIRIIGFSGDGTLEFDSDGNGSIDANILNGQSYPISVELMNNDGFRFDGGNADSLAELNYFEIYYQWMDKAGAFSEETDTLIFNTYKGLFEFDGVTGKDAWYLISSFIDGITIDDFLSDLNLFDAPCNNCKVVNSGEEPRVFTYSPQDEQLVPVTNYEDTLRLGDALVIKILEDEDTTQVGVQGGWPKFEALDELENGYFQGSGYIVQREIEDIALQLNYSSNLTTPKFQGYNIVGNPYGQSWVWNQQNALLNNISSDIAIWDPIGNSGDGKWLYPTYPNISQPVVIKPGEAFVTIATNGQNELGFSFSGRITDQVTSSLVGLGKVEPITSARFTINNNGYQDLAFVRKKGKSGSRNIKKLQVFTGNYHEVFVIDSLNLESEFFATTNAFDTSGIAIPFGIRSTLFDTASVEVIVENLPKVFDSVYVLQLFPNGDELRHFEENGFYEFSLIEENGVFKPEGDLTLIYKNEGIQVSAEEEDETPNRLELFQNYPNPFNPSTRINYQVPETGKVQLKVFDMLGREVATLVNSLQSAGSYSVNFDAAQLSSGMYLYRIETSQGSFTRKMLLLK